MDDSSASTIVPRKPRAWWPYAKWGLFLILLYFVGKRAVALWQSSPPTQLRIDTRWLIPAAAIYLTGWLPAALFWRSLLKRMGQHPTFYQTLHAHYLAHLGKYVPGKAMVLVIRGALIKQSGGNAVAGALTAAYETLIFMSAGAAIALALAPVVNPDGLWDQFPESWQFLRRQTLLFPIAAVIATLIGSPFTAWLFTRIGHKAVPSSTDSATRSDITSGQVLKGLFITSFGWVCHAFSLGFTLQAISATPMNLAQFPVWLASVTLSTFAGFVILIAPGGLGVREWILVEMLKDQPGIGTEQAILAAGLLRAVWFVAELLAAGTLYCLPPRQKPI